MSTVGLPYKIGLFKESALLIQQQQHQKASDRKNDACISRQLYLSFNKNFRFFIIKRLQLNLWPFSRV